MKLEMASPWEQLHICPVSVTKVSPAGDASSSQAGGLTVPPSPPSAGLQRRLLPGDGGRSERGRQAAARGLSR